MSGRKLNRNPVRRGAIYCSSACGGQCTFAAFQKATADAEKLAKTLGEQWKPRVWENLGWHYSAMCGESQVHPSGTRRYWADLRAGGQQFESHGASPRGAVSNAFAQMNATARGIDEAAKMLRRKLKWCFAK